VLKIFCSFRKTRCSPPVKRLSEHSRERADLPWLFGGIVFYHMGGLPPVS
jgi:hypothetical protein